MIEAIRLYARRYVMVAWAGRIYLRSLSERLTNAERIAYTRAAVDFAARVARRWPEPWAAEQLDRARARLADLEQRPQA